MDYHPIIKISKSYYTITLFKTWAITADGSYNDTNTNRFYEYQRILRRNVFNSVQTPNRPKDLYGSGSF